MKIDDKELEKIFLDIKQNKIQGIEELYSKYKKVVYGIAFTISKNKEAFSIDTFDFENYTSSSNANSSLDQSSMDDKLEKIYLEELEKNVMSKFEENEITVSKCTIDAELDTTKKNAGIHSIVVKIKAPVDEEKIEEIREEIATEFEIDLEKIEILVK